MNQETKENCGCKDYTCFHLHSVNSVLDGNNSVKDLVKKHKELGFKTMILTDHGNICGTYDLFTECEKAGIKPVIGCEFYMPHLDNPESAKAHHITSVVLNENGWKNMLKLQYISQHKDNEIELDGFKGQFHFKPKVTTEMLFNYCKNDIALTTGCRVSIFNHLFLSGKEDEAINQILSYKQNIRNFFIELHIADNEVEEKMYWFLKEQAFKHNIPTLIGNDAHYIEKGDLISWNLLSSSRHKTSIYNTERSIKNDDFYIKSLDQTKQDLLRIESKKNPDVKEQDILPLFNGFSIMEQITQFKWENRKLPMLHYDNAKKDLKEFLWKELQKMFGGKKYIPQKYLDRIKEEFEIADKTNNISYFYMIQLFLSKCKERGLMMSNGRGSASSLLICKLIGASRVDPLEYGLIIERAMNIDRPKLMDVDLDFANSEGQEAFEILQELFGAENICNIVNFGYNGIKASVQAVCRYLKINPAKVDALTKELNRFEEEDEDGNKHTSMANQEQQLELLIQHEFTQNFSLYLPDGSIINGDMFIDLVKRMWNTINNLSVHASGILIMNDKIYNHIPVVRVKDTICSAYDMAVLEKVNGLKLDVLKIKTNDIIKYGLNILNKDGVL